MQAFRNSAKPIIIAVSISFFAWLVLDLSGIVGGTGFATRTSVGTINGRSVDLRQYQAAVDQAIQEQQRQSPGPLGIEAIQQIRDQVWDQVVQSSVLESEYQKRGLKVTADEIAAAIRESPPEELRQFPDFQTDGKFDLAKYQRWLQSNVAQQFLPQLESRYRDDLLRSKLLRVVTADVFLSDAELWQKFRDQNETVKIRLAALIPGRVGRDTAGPVSDAEAQAYYGAHRDDFKRTSTAFLSYVALPRITGASDTAAALVRARAVREEILKGAPFAEVAQRESADSASAAHGGDLGEWTRGSFDPAFEKVAFSIPLNQVSEPVLSAFGFHIIQVTKRSGAKANGRHILIPIELAGAHRDLVDAQADSLEKLAAERLDPAALDTVARALRLQVRATNPVQQGTKVQIGVLVVPDAGVWAFQAKPGEISPVIETEYAFYLFRLDSLRNAGVPPLAQVRDAVERAVRDERGTRIARELAEALMKRVSEGSPLAQAADALGIPHRDLGPFNRVSPPLPNPVLVGTAFGLGAGETSGVLDTKDGIYLLQVLEHTKADSTKFLKNLPQLRQETRQAAQQSRVRDYLAALRLGADITDDRAAIFRTSAQAESSVPQGRKPSR